MDIENIKKKVKKLLALSESSTFDEESHTALMRAQELMAKYKLEQMDIEDKEEQKCIQKKTILSYGTRSSDSYRDELASIIADNFCCVNYISTRRGSRTHFICLMGMQDDVEIACDALYTADNAIIRGYNRVYKMIAKEYGLDYVPAKYFNPAKEGYVKGYLAGLKKALEDQKEQNQEWGLVLVAPKEAQEFMGGLDSVSFGGVKRVDNSYYDEGYTDGKNFQMSKKLGNNSQDKITG